MPQQDERQSPMAVLTCLCCPICTDRTVRSSVAVSLVKLLMPYKNAEQDTSHVGMHPKHTLTQRRSSRTQLAVVFCASVVPLSHSPLHLFQPIGQTYRQLGYCTGLACPPSEKAATNNATITATNRVAPRPFHSKWNTLNTPHKTTHHVLQTHQARHGVGRVQ